MGEAVTMDYCVEVELALRWMIPDVMELFKRHQLRCTIARGRTGCP